jgi:hypothetical protein
MIAIVYHATRRSGRQPRRTRSPAERPRQPASEISVSQTSHGDTHLWITFSTAAAAAMAPTRMPARRRAQHRHPSSVGPKSAWNLPKPGNPAADARRRGGASTSISSLVDQIAIAPGGDYPQNGGSPSLPPNRDGAPPFRPARRRPETPAIPPGRGFAFSGCVRTASPSLGSRSVAGERCRSDRGSASDRPRPGRSRPRPGRYGPDGMSRC